MEDWKEKLLVEATAIQAEESPPEEPHLKGQGKMRRPKNWRRKKRKKRKGSQASRRKNRGK